MKRKHLKLQMKRLGAAAIAVAMTATMMPAQVLADNVREEEKALVYFVDCGDYVVDTVCSGDEMGTHNSVTDQIYGEDQGTGYMWGIVDTVSDPLVNGSRENMGVFTDYSWPLEYGEAGKDRNSKTESNRYTKNQFENNIETRYLDYKFELEAGTYNIETYTTDPWSCSKSPTLILDGTGKTREEITAAFKEGEGTVLSSNTVARQSVTLAEDGQLMVSFRGEGDDNKAINVCYIKITDASLENPEEFVQLDLESLNFPSTYVSGDLTLPSVGENGSRITWTSSNEAVISTDGKVSRPAPGQEDVSVELTAAAAYDTAVRTKTFSFQVYAESEFDHAQQFPLDAVTVTDTYYKAAQDSDIAFLKRFDNDRILSRFRETAGLDTNGAESYQGWENSLIGGHSVGHYLSACAQAVKATGDEELRGKLETLIDELARCQENLGTGFLFGARIDNPENVELQFDIVEGKASGDTWVPWYTMHKIVTGLIDTYKYTDDPDALEIAENLGEWIYDRVSQWDIGTQQRISWTEYGGMNDCLYELYKLTGNPHFRDAAHKFDDPALYREILSGKANTLNQRHANTTIPKFLGALNRYQALVEMEDQMTDEDEKYLEYAEGFWALVVEKHTFITGGTSDMEHFKADNCLDAIRTQCNCESCCAHNMLKMTRELFKITGDKKYADYYETTLRNAIMGAINPDNGTTTYFTPMATGYYKVFGEADPADNMFWCCTGSGMENYTKLGDSIYFYKNDALIVNQYVASEVSWKENNIKLVQDSDVTASEEANFQVNLLNGASSADMKLYLKIPDWISGEAVLKVNGQAQSAIRSNGYVCIDRQWADGDTVSLTYPMKVAAYGLADNPTVYGFQYGPTVLAARLGTEEWESTTWAGANLGAPAYKVVGPEKVRLNVSYGQTTRQILGTETLEIQDGLSISYFMEHADEYFEKTGSGASLSFKIKGTDADDTFADGLNFVPFNTLNDERYGIYWYFQGGDSEASEDVILADKEEGRFAASLVDSIQPGYPQYETDDIHQMEEENTGFGNMPGIGSSRYAEAGGHFSYNMVVKKESANLLLCQFAAEDNGRTIKITAGDTVIAQETLSYDGDESSYRKYYEIPEEEIKKAQELEANGETHHVLKVRFESADEKESARLVSGLFMTTPYHNDAGIVEIAAAEGTVSREEDTFTLRVPRGTDTVKITVTIADKMGLLYMDGRLVNDTKAQTVSLSDEATQIALKVYGEDHTTFKDYTLNIVSGEEITNLEEIIKKAQEAQEAAQKAQAEAEQAKMDAQEAQKEAQEAKRLAQEAQQQAGADSDKAKEAWEKAQEAQQKAEEAQEAAEAAMTRAEEKAAEAEAVLRKAETALKQAEEARQKAEEAQKQEEADRLAAEAAAKKAEADKKAAEQALKAVQEAQQKAEAAQKAAQEAQAAVQKAKEELEKAQGTNSQNITVKRARITAAEKGKKGRIKIKWQKVSNASGYELQYTTGSKFTKAKTKQISSAKSGYTLKRLKSGKICRIRLRAYQKVSGKKVYGAYSKVKRVKVK